MRSFLLRGRLKTILMHMHGWQIYKHSAILKVEWLVPMCTCSFFSSSLSAFLLNFVLFSLPCCLTAVWLSNGLVIHSASCHLQEFLWLLCYLGCVGKRSIAALHLWQQSIVQHEWQHQQRVAIFNCCNIMIGGLSYMLPDRQSVLILYEMISSPWLLPVAEGLHCCYYFTHM